MIVETRGLEKTYGRGETQVQALRGVTLTVASGEMLALVGPSGCGKSTLLRLIAGLDRPTAGEVMLLGDRVDDQSERAWARLRRREIGFVFQFFNLLGDLSVAENVELPALLGGLGRAEARRRRETLLTELELEHRALVTPAALSGGEQQRVAVARALVNRPAVILADEPTGNLDSDGARTVLAAFRRAREWTRSIVLVTHDPRVAAQADRVMTLRDGEIVEEVRMDDGEDASARRAGLLALESWS